MYWWAMPDRQHFLSHDQAAPNLGQTGSDLKGKAAQHYPSGMPLHKLDLQKKIILEEALEKDH